MGEFNHELTLKRYDDELGDINRRLLEMGRRVVVQLEQAVVAFNTGDVNAATQVVAADKDVDRLALETDDAIFKLIAQRSPVGIDLRTVLAFSKCCSALERIADEAAAIATAVIELFGNGLRVPNNPLVCAIRKMGDKGVRSLQRALLLFESWSDTDALAVIAMYREMDDEFRADLRCLMTFVMEDYRTVGFVIYVVVVMRSLERIGHYAGNIAQDAILRVKGFEVSLDEL